MANINPMVDDIEIQLSNGNGVMINMIDADLMEFRWHETSGSCNNTSYARGIIERNEGQVALHRVIFSRMINRELEVTEYVDHIDRNGLNNRRGNLRLATNSQNQGNSGLHPKNTSGYKGVVLRSSGRWRAAICGNNLGTYDTPEEAHEAYKRAARKRWGEFANI